MNVFADFESVLVVILFCLTYDATQYSIFFSFVIYFQNVRDFVFHLLLCNTLGDCCTCLLETEFSLTSGKFVLREEWHVGLSK